MSADKMLHSMLLGHAMGDLIGDVARFLGPNVTDEMAEAALLWRDRAMAARKEAAQARAGMAQLERRLVRMNTAFRGMNDLMIDIRDELRKADPNNRLVDKTLGRDRMIYHMQNYRLRKGLPMLTADELADMFP